MVQNRRNVRAGKKVKHQQPLGLYDVEIRKEQLTFNLSIRRLEDWRFLFPGFDCFYVSTWSFTINFSVYQSPTRISKGRHFRLLFVF